MTEKNGIGLYWVVLHHGIAEIEIENFLGNILPTTPRRFKMRLLTFATLLSVFFAFQSSAESAVIGQWNCDETSGTTLNDSSGNGHHGTLNGGATWSLPGGVSFNGDGYFQIPNDPQLTLTDTFSATAWVKRVDGKYLTILSKATGPNGANNYEFNIVQDGRLNFQFYNGGWNVNSRISTGSISANTWHTVRADYDSQHVKYWIDGILDSSFAETTPMLGNSGPLYIGLKTSSGPPDYSFGTIRDLTLSTVPEPSTLLLLSVGAISLIFVWRRRK